MFKWLTRNDGKRVERAKRRIASPRASVFTEFALVVPIVALVCSAMIEIVGYWDAQVMANHAAWTVGRIAMVRGSDGMEFSNDLSKKSKTGIKGSSMPQLLKSMLGSLDTVIGGANKFNNRGNIATMFLMSTCGIGYYGASPGRTLSDGFTTLCNDCMKGIKEGIPEAITSAVTSLTLPSFIDNIGSGSAIEKLVNNIVKGVVDKLTEWALKPVADAIGSLLQKAFDNIFGKEGSKIDKIFSGDGEAARHARQMYGAASRLARAKAKTGKEVVTVEDMDGLRDSFLFAKQSTMKRLAYPQVVDKEAKSDGYFVTGAHGWPANNNGLAMIHVEINWPYESGWLFPIVSGYGSSASAPVAKGHSMVFPSPDIQNENLYSEGATAYAEGKYTASASQKDLDDLANDMRKYLGGSMWCMKHRISYDRFWIPWEVIRDYDIGARNDQERWWWAEFLHHGIWIEDKMWWDGYYHPCYQYCNIYTYYSGWGINYKRGDSGLGSWYDGNKALNWQDDTTDRLKNPNNYDFSWIGSEYFSLSQQYINCGLYKLMSFDTFRSKMKSFGERMKVNVYNIVRWDESQNLSTWNSLDRELEEKAKKADRAYGSIRQLLEDEIKEIQDMLDGNSTWSGDESDPVFDPNDEEFLRDPEKAVEKARQKWADLKERLRKKLKDVEKGVEELRSEWERYYKDGNSFKAERQKCVEFYFWKGCIEALYKTQDKNLLDRSYLNLPKGCFPYDITAGTRSMISRTDEYLKKVNKSWDLEVEYGAMMGLKAAGEAKKSGRRPEDVFEKAGNLINDTPGNLNPGSDKGFIIDHDHQEFSGGEWKWK